MRLRNKIIGTVRVLWYYDAKDQEISLLQFVERISNGMNCIEIILAIINLLAVVASPIIAVWVGQKLQDREQKRKDKMAIFQCLMTRRITGWWVFDAVNALNSIDIIFSDSDKVREQWRILLSKYRPEIDIEEKKREQCKLLELMAVDLGYKDKITWETIQNPYCPVGLAQQWEENSKIMDGQLEWAKAVGKVSQLINTNTAAPTSKASEDSSNANS